MKNAPGKAYRKGITLKQILRMFPNNEIAEQWLTEQRWPNGVCCPACGSVNVQTGCQHKTMPYRCREKECVKKFSVKTGTVMEGSKVGYQDWLLGAFLLMTSLKSVSSMKLHRDLGITQKSAWFLAQRLRVALSQDGTLFAGPVEVDETYFGGKRRNMSNATRKELADTGRGPVGKTAVVGVKDRATKHVAARVVTATDAATLQGFVREHTEPGATVYTDDHGGYEGMPFDHATVKHSLSEYVKGDIHTNGIESLWSMLKRARTFIQASAAKLHEFHERDLSNENVVAIVLDGKTFAEATMVIALGITMTGEKRFLGFVETDTENAQVLTPFLRSLLERGLDISQGVLVILDGGKGLRAAVRKAFRRRAVVQRCQWHKRENVVSYLAKTEQPLWRQRLQRAYHRPEYDEAVAALRQLQGELEDRNQSAARSLTEGFDETLTLHRLGLYGVLGRSLKTTNCLESINALVEERCAKVDRWQNSSQRHRWLATALVDIEPRLRKVMGYRHLPKLRDALQRELKIDTTTSKKEAA